jgi:L-iditol 2-dehydrogenase
LLEPLGVALHAVDLAHVRAGASVGVFGCGPIGLLALQAARLAGAGRLVAHRSRGRPRRLEAARGVLGAEVFRRRSWTRGAFRSGDALGGRLDVAIELAGCENAARSTQRSTRCAGRARRARGDSGRGAHSFGPRRARRKGLTLVLSRRMKHTYPRAIGLVAEGNVDVRSAVKPHRFPLERAGPRRSRRPLAGRG